MVHLNKTFDLYQLLNLDRRIQIVDIGASPITGDAPYIDLLESGAAHLIGFEPDKKELENLQSKKSDNEEYFPYAIGDGADKVYYSTPATGLSSTRPLSPWVGDYFGPWWRRQERRVEKIPMGTRKLDDVLNGKKMDILKIDIQGGELEVFENAQISLGDCVSVQTEIALMPFYQNQPDISDICRELGKYDLIPFCFTSVNKRKIHSNFLKRLQIKNTPSQILDLDFIFVKNPVFLSNYSTDFIKRLCLVSYGFLSSLDLACKCVDILLDREELEYDVIKDVFDSE